MAIIWSGLFDWHVGTFSCRHPSTSTRSTQHCSWTCGARTASSCSSIILSLSPSSVSAMQTSLFYVFTAWEMRTKNSTSIPLKQAANRWTFENLTDSCNSRRRCSKKFYCHIYRDPSCSFTLIGAFVLFLQDNSDAALEMTKVRDKQSHLFSCWPTCESVKTAPNTRRSLSRATPFSSLSLWFGIFLFYSDFSGSSSASTGIWTSSSTWPSMAACISDRRWVQ